MDITLAIHPANRRTHAVVGRQRLVLATALVGRHDKDGDHAFTLSERTCRRIWGLEAPVSTTQWPVVLASLASSILDDDGANDTYLSFTLMLLGSDGAHIFNCGGHRVLSMTSPMRRIVNDGFVNLDNRRFRHVVQAAAGPSRPVDASVIHQGLWQPATEETIIISPHGELMDMTEPLDPQSVRNIVSSLFSSLPVVAPALALVRSRFVVTTPP